MPQFIKGKELCRSFFEEEAQPILKQRFPNLRYSAGLLGYGSDVLGYDDAVSTDHMWGPRFYLFLSAEDQNKYQAEIESAFANNLPYVYRGYSVNFSVPDPNDHGVRHAEWIDSGKVSPLIFIYTPEHFLTEYIGTSDLDHWTAEDWLSCSEHRLLALTKAEFYRDDLQLNAKLQKLSYYPEEVRLYLIASNWALIEQEQAFVKRCGIKGDELGSRIICARIVERLMRLCFLYQKVYAPYSKWFGTAFSELSIDPRISSVLSSALAADTVEQREHFLVEAQCLVGELHNQSDEMDSVSFSVSSYFGRDIRVIQVDRFIHAAAKRLEKTKLTAFPKIGTFSQVGNFTELSDSAQYRSQISEFYRSFL
jgi:hypothetical protein